jgi:V8-like Glu-specific endopeptidase
MIVKGTNIAKISQINIWHDSYVNGIEVFYGGISRGPVYGTKLKDLSDKNLVTLPLDPDEYIKEISGRCGCWIDQLAFKTTKGKSVKAGTSTGGADFILAVEDQIVFSLEYGVNDIYLQCINAVFKPLANEQTNLTTDAEEIYSVSRKPGYKSEITKKVVWATKECVLKRVNLGQERRTRINTTHDYPYSVHGLIKAYFGEKNEWISYGSGTLIGPNTVLTAAHVIYNFGGKANYVEFIPAINKNDTPYGIINAKKIFYPAEFVESEGANEDYGILILDQEIGEKTGFFGISVLKPEMLKKKKYYLYGYPEDLCPNYDEMWGANFPIDKVEEDNIYYRVDTYGGQSGSAIYYEKDGNYFVVGVHTGGDDKGDYNVGILLTEKRIRCIKEWEKEKDSPVKLEGTQPIIQDNKNFMNMEIKKTNYTYKLILLSNISYYLWEGENPSTKGRVEVALNSIKKKYINCKMSNLEYLDSNDEMFAVIDGIDKEVFIVFRGTELTSISDLLNDAKILLLKDYTSFKYKRVKKFVTDNVLNIVRKRENVESKKYKIYTTGHSLGGLVAEHIAWENRKEGFKCESFNAAFPRLISGLIKNGISSLFGWGDEYSDNIISYHINGDRISNGTHYGQRRDLDPNNGLKSHKLDNFMYFVKKYEKEKGNMRPFKSGFTTESSLIHDNSVSQICSVCKKAISGEEGNICIKKEAFHETCFSLFVGSIFVNCATGGKEDKILAEMVELIINWHRNYQISIENPTQNTKKAYLGSRMLNLFDRKLPPWSKESSITISHWGVNFDGHLIDLSAKELSGSECIVRVDQESIKENWDWDKPIEIDKSFDQVITIAHKIYEEKFKDKYHLFKNNCLDFANALLNEIAPVNTIKEKTTAKLIFPYKIPETDYTLKVLCKEDIPAAIGVLAGSNIDHEPLVSWAKTTYGEEYKSLMNLYQEPLSKGPSLSVIITNTSNEIIDVSIMIPLNLEFKNLEGSAAAYLSVAQMNRYVEHYRKSNLEGKCAQLLGYGVSEKASGKGFARYLSLGVASLAAENGFTWFMTLCSNAFSADIAIKMGLKKVEETIYDEFLYNVEKPFAGLDAFFTKKLNERLPDRQLKSSAKSLITFEGKTEDILKI